MRCEFPSPNGRGTFVIREVNKLKFEVIDADRHVSEPLDMWREYLPEPFKRYAPYLDTAEELNDAEASSEVERDASRYELYVDGKPLCDKLNYASRKQAIDTNEKYGDPTKMAAIPAGQLASMDQAGIDTCVLFPTIAGYCVNSSRIEPAVSEAFASAYNSWLHDYCAHDKSRLIGVGLISRQDPKGMVKELNRVIAFGWHTVMLRPEPIRGRSLSHPDYEEFWSSCEKHHITIVIHGGTHLPGVTTGADRFESRFAQHACSHVMEAQMAFLSLLDGGVLERYSQLKFSFLESGASWVPSWLWRLDEICYTESKAEVADVIKMKPSEYFKRQCWVGFEIGEPGLRNVIDTIGIEHLLFGTDYPHPDHLHLDLAELHNEESELTSDEVKIILSENPRHLFAGETQKIESECEVA